MALCKNLSISRPSLKVLTSSWFCRYHQSKAEYPISRLTNAGLCPEAFHSLYPSAFSMLYADEKGHIAQCNCPGVEGNIIFQLAQKPVGWMHRLSNVFKKAIGFIFTSEIIHYEVFIGVKQSNPACPYNYQKDDFFMFDLGRETAICPAAFYNIFPSIIPQVYSDDKTGTAGRAGDSLAYACPDHYRNILFKLQDKRGQIQGISETENYRCCRPMPNLTIDVKTVTGTCYKSYKAKERFMLRDILGSLNFPCLTALHSAYPYIHTLLKGGKLGFYTHNYESAIIQCPNADAKVEMEIKRVEADVASIRILNLKNSCPLGLTKGHKFILPFKQLDKFCISALMAMYPYLIHHDKFLPQEIICPGRDGKVCFAINNL